MLKKKKKNCFNRPIMSCAIYIYIYIYTIYIYGLVCKHQEEENRARSVYTHIDIYSMIKGRNTLEKKASILNTCIFIFLKKIYICIYELGEVSSKSYCIIMIWNLFELLMNYGLL